MINNDLCRLVESGAAHLWLGDCVDVLPLMGENSIDAVVCDPPYGLAFMGKAWDHGVPNADVWRAVLRVLKPGGHLLAFGGTRTYHRMACAIEDAGFEIRDQIGWVFGSGFPKSKNLDGEHAGWGTALKPAWEPVVLARKPLAGTVAANVQKHGTAALNIDGCRVAMSSEDAAYIAERIRGFNATRSIGGDGIYAGGGKAFDRSAAYDASKGRWPANLIHDGSDEVMALFPGASGQLDAGSAARFFYCAKASKADREGGCDELTPIHRPNGNKWTDQDYRVARGERPPSAESGPLRNHHPTVKPTDLMRYLCRLVTPPGGVVLDPFMGSGSTGRGALLEGFRFIGIEREADYFCIAQARISAVYDLI